MKVFDFLNKFKKKQDFQELPPATNRSGLPDELERFRVKRWPEMAPEPEFQEGPVPFEQVRPPQPMGAPIPEPSKDLDKMDFILQKLDTIDARLKLIEERLRK